MTTPAIITHAAYMADGANLHHAYYMQFVTDETKAFVRHSIGLDKLKTSKDKYFNDIIKHSNGGRGGWIWDHSPYNLELMLEAGEVSAGYRPSLSTRTCIGKACARDMLAKEGAPS